MSASAAEPIELAAPTPVVVLRSAEFRKGREAAWRDLEALIARLEAKGVAGLTADEMQRLPTLYRTAISSLSVARTRPWNTAESP